MLIEVGQAVAEAAKQGSVTIAIPTAFLSSAATLLLYKGVPFVIGAIRGKPRNGNGHGPKPGESETCKEHSDAIAKFEEFKGNTKDALVRIEGKVDRLLERQ